MSRRRAKQSALTIFGQTVTAARQWLTLARSDTASAEDQTFLEPALGGYDGKLVCCHWLCTALCFPICSSCFCFNARCFRDELSISCSIGGGRRGHEATPHRCQCVTEVHNENQWLASWGRKSDLWTPFLRVDVQIRTRGIFSWLVPQLENLRLGSRSRNLTYQLFCFSSWLKMKDLLLDGNRFRRLCLPGCSGFSSDIHPDPMAHKSGTTSRPVPSLRRCLQLSMGRKELIIWCLRI